MGTHNSGLVGGGVGNSIFGFHTSVGDVGGVDWKSHACTSACLIEDVYGFPQRTVLPVRHLATHETKCFRREKCRRQVRVKCGRSERHMSNQFGFRLKPIDCCSPSRPDRKSVESPPIWRARQVSENLRIFQERSKIQVSNLQRIF